MTNQMDTDPKIIKFICFNSKWSISVVHFSYSIYFIQPQHFHVDIYVIFIWIFWEHDP